MVLGSRYSAFQGSRPEENTGGGCWLSRRAIRLLLDLEQSIYCDPGNVERIVELWRINQSRFSIPFISIHSN